MFVSLLSNRKSLLVRVSRSGLAGLVNRFFFLFQVKGNGCREEDGDVYAGSR